MAVDKNKIIAEATKLVQKGAVEKAIQMYQRVLAADPKDVRVLLKVGELLQKKGENKQAAEAFKRVGETYAEQGFFLKSVAVYKQIVKLDPDDVRVNERLAALYQQLGLMSDAMSQLQLVAVTYEKQADGARLTDVLKRMVELDPDNIASSIKLGEMYARVGQEGPALEHLGRAADYLRKHSRADEYLKVAERIVFLRPGEVGLSRELANIYLAKGDTKRALSKLQLCFKADPKDVETLDLLAKAFKDLGQISKTISVLKELARVEEESGRGQEARSTWRRVRELAPDDAEAQAALGGAPAPVSPQPAAPRVVPAVSPPAFPPPGARAAVAPPPGAPVGAAAPPAAPAGPEQIAKLLTETDVYVKYGLHDKALDHLRKVLAADPEHPDALEKFREIQLAAGRTAEAAEAGVRAVKGCVERDLLDRARDALARLRQIAPDHPQLTALSSLTGGTEEVALEPGDVEEVALLQPEVPVAPPLDEDALALAAATGGDGEEIVDEAHDRAAALEPVPSPGAGGEGELDLSIELEEADFFMQQGLLGEAREALENLHAFHPGHSQVMERMAELDRKAAAPLPPAFSPAAASRPAPSPADAGMVAPDDAFDIARELAEEIGTGGAAPADGDFQYSVDDVFSQFKKGVEQTVKPEDSATHYDLGIAYREMGLVDDAIQEFEMALKGNDRKREVDCLTMIGLCRISKGELPKAIEAFRRALGSAHLTREAAKAVLFELGAAYQAAGQGDHALHCFHKVKATDAGFRDVARRIAALGGGPGRPPPGGGARATSNGAAPRPAAVERRPAGPNPPPAAVPRPGPKKNVGYL